MNNEMTTDNMSNEEVIEVLKGIVFGGFDRTTRKERQALDLAIKSLQERPQDEKIDKVKALVDDYCLNVVNKASEDIKAYLFDKILDVFTGED